MRRRSCTWSAAAALAVAALAPAGALAQQPAHVYATANGGAALSGYRAGDAGLLAPLAVPAVATGAKPAGVVASPDGRSLYVVNQDDATVSQYDVAADGAVTPKAVAVVATGGAPLGIAIDPAGAHVYVAHQGDGSVWVYDVGANGALTPASSVPAGDAMASPVVTPDGRNLYVTDFSGAAVAQFAIAPDGSLAPLSPARVAAGSAPFDVAVAPDGARVYVTNQSTAGTVLQYDRAADGTLAPKAVPEVAAERLPAGIAVSADSVYVANFGSGTVSQYDVAAGGALAPKAAGPVAAAVNPWGVALAPDRTSLYVANFGAASLSQYDVGAGGALAPKAVAAVAAGVRPVELAVVRAADLAPPSVDLRTPAEGAVYETGDDVVADFACADSGGSGLASCSGTLPAGAKLDTSRAGSFSFTVVARDGDGNETTVTHAYRIRRAPFAWGGFLDPLREPPRRNVRRAGDDIEIRFRLGGFVGWDVLAAGAPTYARVDCDDPSVRIGETRPAKSALHPRVRFGRGVYRFVWETKDRWARTCRLFTLTLADGTRHQLLFRLEKRSSARWRAAKARAAARGREALR